MTAWTRSRNRARSRRCVWLGRRCAAAAGAILLLLLGAVAPAAAQSDDDDTADHGFRLAAGAGPTINDFETGGVDWIFTAGAEWRPVSWPAVLTLEVRYFSYELAEREQIVMPELGLQLQARFGPVRPFVGTGLGLQYAFRSGRDTSSSFSTHLSTGLRIRLTPGVDLKLEVRGRSIDPVIGFTAGLAIGL